MNIAVDADGKVIMSSETGSPTPPLGGRLVALTTEQAEASKALPLNDGVMFDGEAFTTIPPRVSTTLDGNTAAMIRRRADELATSPDLVKQVEGLKLRLQLLGG